MADAILIGSDIMHCEKSVEVVLVNAGMCFKGVHLENITVSKNRVFNDCNWNIYCSAAPSVLRIITVTSELQRRENTGSWKLSLAYLCGSRTIHFVGWGPTAVFLWWIYTSRCPRHAYRTSQSINASLGHVWCSKQQWFRVNMAKILNKDPVTYQRERDGFIRDLQHFHETRG